MMQIRYDRVGFEDVLFDSEEVVRHFQCHLIPTLAHYTNKPDLRNIFQGCLRNACTRFFWDLQSIHESNSKVNISIPPVEVLEGYLREEIETIKFEDLLESKALCKTIQGFGERLHWLWDFLEMRCRRGMVPKMIGYGPIESPVGPKFHLNQDIDLLYEAGGETELLVLADPFTSTYIYEAMTEAFRIGLAVMNIHPKIYLVDFRKTAYHVPQKKNLRGLTTILNGLYAAERGTTMPVGESFRPGKMPVCKTCTYQRGCSRLDRGAVIDRSHELRQSVTS